MPKKKKQNESPVLRDMPQIIQLGADQRFFSLIDFLVHEKRLHQFEVADLMKVSVTTVKRWLSRDTAVPVSYLDKACKVWGVCPYWLFLGLDLDQVHPVMPLNFDAMEEVITTLQYIVRKAST